MSSSSDSLCHFRAEGLSRGLKGSDKHLELGRIRRHVDKDFVRMQKGKLPPKAICCVHKRMADPTLYRT